MKRYCNKRYPSENKFEYHAIDRAVYKWKGQISFEEFMNTVKNGRLIENNAGKFWVTEKWTCPLMEVSGKNKATTIYRTGKELLIKLKKK